MITFDDYCAVASQIVDHIEASALARSFKAFCQSGDNNPEIFIRQHSRIPPEYILARVTAEQLHVNDAWAEERICKWAQKQGYGVQDTICGLAIDRAGAESLREYLATTYPFQAVVRSKISSLSAYDVEQLRMIVLKSLIKDDYHPSSDEKYFFHGTRSDVDEIVSAALYQYRPEESCLPKYYTVASAAKLFSVSPKAMEKWMNSHKALCTELCGLLLVAREQAESLFTAWQESVTINSEIISEALHIDSQKAKLVETAVSNYSELIESLTVPIGTFPSQTGKAIVCASKEFAYAACLILSDTVPILPLHLVAAETSVPRKRIKSVLGDKITVSQYKAQLQIIHDYVSLDAVIQEIMPSTSTFTMNSRNIAILTERCDAHEWWDISFISSEGTLLNAPKTGKLIPIESKSVFEANNRLFFLTYGQSSTNQLRAYCSFYSAQFPEAARHILSYLSSVPLDKHKAYCDMTDMLFTYLLKNEADICSFNKDELVIMANNFQTFCSRTSCELFSLFLFAEGLIDVELKFQDSNYHSETSEPYNLDLYALIVSCICDCDYWQKLALVEKAVKEKKFADLWLFLAMHVFSVLRKTDLDRLSPPILKDDPGRLLMRIESGSFSDSEAQKVYQSFFQINRAYRMKPHKTLGTQGVPAIYIHCPEDYVVQAGTILAIAAAHYQLSGSSGPFIRTYFRPADIRKFFGVKFARLFGMRMISSRRAHKALMKMVYTLGVMKGDSPARSHLIVSGMRSHKVSLFALSEITSLYLALDYTDIDFVVFQLFQRGSFGYVMDEFLKLCYGKAYEDLTFHKKTEVISKVKLTPYNLSEIKNSILRAQAEAADMVLSLGLDSAKASEALQRITNDEAINKCKNGDCVMAAINRPCAKPDLKNCIFCRYAILPKAMYAHLYNEARRLTLMKSNAVNNLEEKKIDAILNQKLIPAIEMIIGQFSDDSDETREVILQFQELRSSLRQLPKGDDKK